MNFYPIHYLDIDGRFFLSDEHYLFDSTMRLSLNDVNDIFNLSSSSSIFTKSNFDNILCRQKYFIEDRYVSYMVYHYTANSFFFNGRSSYNQLLNRKRSSRGLDNNLGLTSLFSYSLNIKWTPSLVNNTNIYINDSDSILSDVFFESQDFKHSTLFEFIWAFFPTYIILSILVPSLYLLYSLDEDLDPAFTIKVIGHQWYWSYEFNNWVEFDSDCFEFINFKFDSNIIDTDSLEFGTKRVLEVDKRLVVPMDVTLRFLVTSVMYYILELFLL